MQKKKIIILVILIIGLFIIGIGVYLTFKTELNEYYFGSKKDTIIVDNLTASNIEFTKTDYKLEYVLTFSLTNNSENKINTDDYQFKIIDKNKKIITIIPGSSFSNLQSNEKIYYSFVVSNKAHKLIIE
ncbi:MAG: hypothetical protein GX861_01150, partial [Tenericutes bacterium]|nr:hypothetical protein [Mycoplasmatota bacterium]